jgi:hypothetical protein
MGHRATGQRSIQSTTPELEPNTAIVKGSYTLVTTKKRMNPERGRLLIKGMEQGEALR